MGFYTRHVLPRATHFLCGHKTIADQRRKVVPRAKGQVLEIGIGSGLNLPFYDPQKVEHVWGLEPDIEMWRLADPRKIGFEVDYLEAPAESIPLEEDSADTIVVTYTLCSVTGIVDALRDMRRVLKPGGELLFCEHGAAPQLKVRRWQERLNPIWGKLSGGCRLNLQIPTLLEGGGFKIRSMHKGYIGGPRFSGFNYWGSAV